MLFSTRNFEYAWSHGDLTGGGDFASCFFLGVLAVSCICSQVANPARNAPKPRF